MSAQREAVEDSEEEDEDAAADECRAQSGG